MVNESADLQEEVMGTVTAMQFRAMRANISTSIGKIQVYGHLQLEIKNVFTWSKKGHFVNLEVE